MWFFVTILWPSWLLQKMAIENNYTFYHCNLLNPWIKSPTSHERKASRSLASKSDTDSIIIHLIKDGEQLLKLSELCRVPHTNLLNIEINKSIVIPGFNAFCASISLSAKANDIGYFPLITSSFTDTGVVKKTMQTLRGRQYPAQG